MSRPGEPLVEATEIHAAYGKTPVLHGIDMRVAAGEIMAVVGLNGAGKSTLMRCVAGLKRPTAGRVVVGGVDVHGGGQANIALVLQGVAIERQLTGVQYLRFVARTRGVSRAEARSLATAVIDELDLRSFAERRGSEISGGQARRLQLAGSLVRRPDVLLLDEPTTGLDAVARRHYWTVLRDLADRGLAVVAVTHHVDEASLADSVLVISDGHAVSSGRPEQLVGEAALSVVEVVCGSREQVGAVADALPAVDAERKDKVITLTTADPGTALATVQGLGLPGVSLSVRPAALDDLLIRLAKERQS